MGGSGGNRELTIGLLRLTDAAPVIVAKELGLFAEFGLDVSLSIEPSWANVADKLTYGRLDAAVMLPPLAFAITLGVRGAARRLIVPMSLSLNGNAVTVARDIAEALPAAGGGAIEAGKSLALAIAARQGRLRLAVVHAFSTHNLLLRYWLEASGIDPDRSIEFSVVPPADMVKELEAGRIDGFCAGAPWAEIAAAAGSGATIVKSSEIWRNHPEKCLAVREDWAEESPDALRGVMRALLRAARFCDDETNGDRIAAILAGDAYFALTPEAIRASLPSRKVTTGQRRQVDVSTFFAHAANFPWYSHAAWTLDQLTRWGYLTDGLDRSALIDAVYRPDLLRVAAKDEAMAMPRGNGKIEGAHAAPWTLDADRGAIAMGPDPFCDGATFDWHAHLTGK